MSIIYFRISNRKTTR